MVERFRCGPPLSREERQTRGSLCSSTTTSDPCEPVGARGPLPLQAGEVEGLTSPVQSEGSGSSKGPASVSTQSRMPRVSGTSEGGSDSSITERVEELISER